MQTQITITLPSGKKVTAREMNHNMKDGDVMDVLPGDGDMVQITRSDNGKWNVTNAMNGHGQNSFKDWENSEVLVERTQQKIILPDFTEGNISKAEAEKAVEFMNILLDFANKNAVVGSKSVENLQNFVNSVVYNG